MQQRAAEVVQYAAANFKLHLDYSEASIARVEQALDGIHKHIGAKAEQNEVAIVNLSNGFGAYIGEILRRKYGAHWREHPPNFPKGMEGLDIGGMIVGPLQQVFARITRGPKASIETFYKEVGVMVTQRGGAAASRPAMQESPEQSRKKMREFAAKAIAEAKERFGIELDYTEASLDRLDEVLLGFNNLLTDSVPSEKKLNDDEKFLLKPIAAARLMGYLSEMFCELLGAEWRNNVAGCPPEVSRLSLGGKAVQVLLRGEVIGLPQIIVNCVNDPRHWSAKSYFLDVKRTHQVDSAMSNAASFDDQMAVCAQEAVILARDRYNTTLDFSEASVEVLEKLLAGFHTSLPKPGDPGRPSDQWIASIAWTFGAYLGEIFRKNVGGTWAKHNPKVPGSLPVLNVNGSILTPCHKVSKRILEGPAENVAFFYKAACQVLREGGLPAGWTEVSGC